MKSSSLVIYLVILIALCAAVVGGALALGRQGMYLAQFYMLTPAVAALVTRLFFYRPKFSDANLRFGRLRDYPLFWLVSLVITAVSYVFFTLFGAITWDWSGQVFLDRLARQFAEAGQDMVAALPPGFTPQMMLMVYFIGGLTVFNILPGIITGFGEEFGHRGFMFPLLYRIKPWVGLIIGGLIWYAWHWPLLLVVPATATLTPAETITNFVLLGLGSLCTFTYLAYIYVKSRSVWVTSVAHIAMNNSAAAFSYFAVVQSQFLANVGLVVTMALVVVVLYLMGELKVFEKYFQSEGLASQEVTQPAVAAGRAG